MDDLVFMLDSMGLRTGVDLQKLVAVRKVLERNLTPTELHGQVARAGLPKNYQSAAARMPAAA
jgi:hydroxymethylglutaryl-CoA lyase